MNGTITFDTLEYSRTLKEAGFTDRQAEALAKAHRQAFAQMLESGALATKGDIARLDMAIADVKVQIAETESRMTKAMYNALIGFAAVIATVIIGAVSVAVMFLKP